MNDSQMQSIPKVLETPKEKGEKRIKLIRFAIIGSMHT
jgi:endonuclease IV